MTGTEWKRKYDERTQHTLSHSNHHIHPLVFNDKGIEERKPLKSCFAKGKKECKHQFPLTNLMCDQPVLVCHCVAEERNLTTKGPRSMLGQVLPERNDEWLNAGPRALIAFTGSNADIKYPHRLPILPETHDELSSNLSHICCAADNSVQQAADMQAGMAAAAGYFGGYTAKMQPIGHEVMKKWVPWPSAT